MVIGVDIDQLENDKWERLKSEEDFHNHKFAQLDNEPLHYKYKPTYMLFERMKQKMGSVEDKELLELGCGTGWITCEMAMLGANIRAIDISGEAVEITKRNLIENRLDSRCVVEKSNVEDFECPNDCFDYVIGFAILHHLDLENLFPKLYRILRPNGIALFAEPLGYNPFINVYRKLTPSYRTEHEKPIKFEELIRETSQFKIVRHEEYYLTAIAPFLLIYIPFLRKLYSAANRMFIEVDNKLLSKYPRLGKWAWYTIIEMHK